jgi:hypothetical protein
MRYTFGEKLRNVAAASFLSCLIAAVICGLTSPVTADSAKSITPLVNRVAKGDRLPIAPIVQPTRHNSISIEKLTPSRSLVGCETAFSSIIHPTQANILRSCVA